MLETSVSAVMSETGNTETATLQSSSDKTILETARIDIDFPETSPKEKSLQTLNKGKIMSIVSSTTSDETHLPKESIIANHIKHSKKRISTSSEALNIHKTIQSLADISSCETDNSLLQCNIQEAETKIVPRVLDRKISVDASLDKDASLETNALDRVTSEEGPSNLVLQCKELRGSESSNTENITPNESRATAINSEHEEFSTTTEIRKKLLSSSKETMQPCGEDQQTNATISNVVSSANANRGIPESVQELLAAILSLQSPDDLQVHCCAAQLRSINKEDHFK